MNIIDQRTLTMVKGHGQAEIERRQQRELSFDGYIGRKFLLNTEHPDHDVVIVNMMWESKDKLMAFKKSDIHREGHKNRIPNPNILEHKMTIFQVVE